MGRPLLARLTMLTPATLLAQSNLSGDGEPTVHLFGSTQYTILHLEQTAEVEFAASAIRSILNDRKRPADAICGVATGSAGSAIKSCRLVDHLEVDHLYRTVLFLRETIGHRKLEDITAGRRVGAQSQNAARSDLRDCRCLLNRTGSASEHQDALPKKADFGFDLRVAGGPLARIVDSAEIVRSRALTESSQRDRGIGINVLDRSIRWNRCLCALDQQSRQSQPILLYIGDVDELTCGAYPVTHDVS
jgi:hypothetical protein